MKPLLAIAAAGSLAAVLTASSCAPPEVCGALEADGDDYVQLDSSLCSFSPGPAPVGPMWVSSDQLDESDSGFVVLGGRRYSSHRYDARQSRPKTTVKPSSAKPTPAATPAPKSSKATKTSTPRKSR